MCFFFSSRRRHTRFDCDWSSDVCSSDLLMAQDAAGSRSDFTTWQFGGTLSGPIVPNRVHFFVNADLQQRVVPDVGPLVAADTVGGADLRKTGISYASALRFQQILRDRFGLDPGSLASDGHLPARDVFAK